MPRMRMRAAAVAVLTGVLCFVGSAAQAQDAGAAVTAGEALRSLLSYHISSDDDFQAILHVIQRQVTTFPIGSSSGGFTYTFDRRLGLPVRRTQSFGSVFADRPLTLGRHSMNVRVSTQHTSFRSLGGQSLKDGIVTETLSIPSFASMQAFDDPDQHAIVESYTTTMTFTTRRTLFGVSYGVTDRLEVGAIVPYGETEVSGELQTLAYDYTANDVAEPSCSPYCVDGPVRGHSSGIGDVVAHAKYLFLSRGALDLAAAGEVRLATGDADKLLGLGSTATKLALVGSVAQGPLTHHFQFGYTVVPGSSKPFDPLADLIGDATDAPVLDIDVPNFEPDPGIEAKLATLRRQPDEINYAIGADIAVKPSVTVSGDLIGRSLLKAGTITRNSSILYDTLFVDSGTVNLLLGAVSGKFLVARSWLLTTSVAFPMTNAGFRPGLTTVIGFERAF